MDLFDERSVDKHGAMNADESVWSEFFRDRGHGLMKKIRTRHPGEQNVITLSLDRNHIGGIHKQNRALCVAPQSGRARVPTFGLWGRITRVRHHSLLNVEKQSLVE